jgi:hypothetical protein
MDDFITKVQVEEIYDEQQLQEMHEYYEYLNEQQVDQSGRESFCAQPHLW